VGFRTPAGILDATQSFQTLEIPRIVRGKGPHSWDAGVCLNFANQFLQQLRRNLTVDDGSTSQRRVWRARLVPKQYIAVRELIAPEELLEVQGNEDRVGFLPAWYWKTIAKVSNQGRPPVGEMLICFALLSVGEVVCNDSYHARGARLQTARKKPYRTAVNWTSLT
jgi:RAT1-interacting protein